MMLVLKLVSNESSFAKEIVDNGNSNNIANVLIACSILCGLSVAARNSGRYLLMLTLYHGYYPKCQVIKRKTYSEEFKLKALR